MTSIALRQCWTLNSEPRTLNSEPWTLNPEP
jgi:hypothetical protein